MKLYILRPKSESHKGDAWDPWYDKMFGIVVRASSPTRARKIAAAHCGAEDPGVWEDPDQTTCKVLREKGKEGVIIRDDHWA